MYLIVNEEKIKVVNARSFFKRLMGLMFKKNINYGMLFKHTNSVHTFFMKENIDIIGLNNHNEIIYKALDIPKNKVITIHNSIKNTSILELPSNASKNFKIGQILTFVGK